LAILKAANNADAVRYRFIALTGTKATGKLREPSFPRAATGTKNQLERPHIAFVQLMMSRENRQSGTSGKAGVLKDLNRSKRLEELRRA
jgi:hypothetical protein